MADPQSFEAAEGGSIPSARARGSLMFRERFLRQAGDLAITAVLVVITAVAAGLVALLR